MLGGITWVLAVILIWLVLFVATLTFARYVAREHDREAMEAAISDLKEEHTLQNEHLDALAPDMRTPASARTSV